jgi:predicted O-methyltransferase YrrM
MNETIQQMKEMRRAMQPYVLMIYEMVYEMKPKKILEIGCRQGQSTRTMLSALKELDSGILHTVSVDLPNAGERIPDELKGYWNPVGGNSHHEDTKKWAQTIADEDGKFDILFIDGDHSYEGVKEDFMSYAPLVKPKGLILLHDVTNDNCGVPEFWKEINEKYKSISLPYPGRAGMGIMQLPNQFFVAYHDNYEGAMFSDDVITGDKLIIEQNL